MKQWITLLIALLIALGSSYAAPAEQTLDQINAAAREQVIRELKLSAAQRKRFEPIYTAYRTALDKAIASEASSAAGDETAQRNNLKAKLNNISATAQVKSDYVDRFAEVLTAEQIRTLYNAEGAVATSLKRVAATRAPEVSRLRGSGRMATQDWGAVGNYTTLTAGTYCVITLSPTARTVSVTADDNIIDYIEMTNQGGELGFKFSPNARNIENIHIQITVPLSSSLSAVNTKSYGRVTASMPLKTPSMKINISSYGSVVANIETSGKTSIAASSYGSFKGSIQCGELDYKLSSYASAEGAIESRGSCQMELSSYARFSDNIKAADLVLTISSYAKFTGSVTAPTAQISTSAYSSFSGGFTGNSLVAVIGSYASMNISGAAQVADAQVSVGYSSSFIAPQLRVTNYTIKAPSSSRSEVWCSGVLKFEGSTQARLTYDGPCKLEATAQNIKRK